MKNIKEQVQMTLQEIIEEMERRKQKIREEMGGEKAVKRQHEKGKLTARERVELLFDEGTFEEMGTLAYQLGSDPKKTPADGMIAGYGKINGRGACVAAYDFTVIAGSMGPSGEKKVTRMREWALKHRIPIIWLIDSAGARIQNSAGSSFAATGGLFFEQVIMSGVVPQVCAVMGPGFAGTAYVPALADFTPMVKGTSFLGLGGPPLVKAAIGEDISEQELGGSKIHCEISGVGDLEVQDDAACIEKVREYLSYLPQNNQDLPPVIKTSDPIDRSCDKLNELIPTAMNTPFDIIKLIEEIVDDGKFFEIKPRWARNMVTGFARIGGHSIGIVANQPKWLGGTIDVNASDKAARFINICNAFNVPILYLVDTPAFMIGSAVEKAGIIRHGAKFLHATASATVPKFTIVVRKAFGAGYYVMNGRAYEPDLFLAYPHAQISLMGAEGAVNIVYRKEIANAEEPEARRQELIQEYKDRISVDLVAGAADVDDVINPADTRRILASALERTRGKQVERPWRKIGVVPV
nr:acyl-CoA carboxylase subunit beta [Pueribacillus theae]